MAIDYQSNFNSGELSSKMDGRSQLDIYKNGCRFLQNFFVLPQGGVERRTGTEFVQLTNSGTAGAKKARLIPFSFSSTASYACEFGDEYIRVWSSDGTYVDVTGTVPYADDEIDDLDYFQRFDVMFITHPDHPIQTLTRTTTAPAFEIAEYEFNYPAFKDENEDISVNLKVSHEEWQTATVYYEGDQVYDNGNHYACTTLGDGQTSTDRITDYLAGWWTLINIQSVSFIKDDVVTIESDSASFGADDVGTVFRIRHSLSEAKKVDSGKIESGGASEAILIGLGNSIKVDLTNTYGDYSTYANGRCVIENSNDGITGWVTLATYDSGGSYVYETTLVSPKQYIRVRNTNSAGDYAYTTYSIEAGGNRRVTDSFTANGVSDPLDVSFSKWNVSTGGTAWTGVAEVERSTDGKQTWNTFVVVADTIGLDTGNFTYSSPSLENGNTFIRIKYTYESGTAKITMKNESSFTDGLVLATAFIDSSNLAGIVVNAPSSAGYTSLWSESAFSDKYGYPNAIAFYENRLWLSGTSSDPSTIFASVADDYYNFITGAESDLGIKRVPDTPEEVKWLIGKKNLFMGTEGGAVSVSSVDGNELITASNIKTDFQSVFGASDVAGVLANDVVVYAQKNGLKLRELVYNWEEENFRSNDLTVINDEILESGTNEMFLQKQPDQIIWCQKENGDTAWLTYERAQEVVGWSRCVTEGDIISACPISSSSGEDEIWMCVLRNGNYAIEKMRLRADMDWFVDCGAEYDGGDAVVADSIAIGASPDFKITVTKATHGLLDGATIRFESVENFDWMEGRTFEVADKTAGTFVLKAVGGDYISGEDASGTVTASYAPVALSMSMPSHLEGDTVQLVQDGVYVAEKVVTSGAITFDKYSNTAVAGLKYESILRPMPIEPVLSNRLPNSRIKGVAKVIVKFFKTIGAKVGQEGKPPTIYPAIATTDLTNTPVETKTGDVKFNISSDWTTEKVIEVKQDLPYPMTVLSMSVWTEVKGG